MSRIIRLLVLAAAFTPQTAHAWQRTPPASTARLGELVRVHTADRTDLRGTLAFADRDSMVITGAAGARRVLRADFVRSIDARRVMPRNQRAKRAALVGAAIGFLIPAIESLAKGRHGCESPPPGWTYTSCKNTYGSIEETAPVLMILFGGIGYGIGSAVPWHHWLRVGIAPPGSSP